MTAEEFALAAFVAFFIPTFWILARRDAFVGGVYFFLFVYTIFAQIGYYYFPELSNQIEAYFGEGVFLPYTVFVALSFFAFFAFTMLVLHLARGTSYQVVRKPLRIARLSFWLILLAHVTWTGVYFALNYDLLNYVSMSDPDFFAEQGLLHLVFGISFKYSVWIIIVLYALMRLKGEMRPVIGARWIPLFLLLEVALLAAIAAKTANRTDFVAVTLGICMIEYQLGGGLKKFLKLSVFAVVVLYGLILVEASRSSGDEVEKLLYEAILYKDYFAPAHILFGAMHYGFIEPLEVLASNTANSLILLGHPYLQATVADLFNPGLSHRSASYAFFIFSEGFIALGPLGVIYNGIVIGCGVLLWRALAASENRAYSIFMLALISTQMANIVRSQSAYFIKDLYVFFIPAMLLFFLASGLRPAFMLKLYRKRSP